MTQPSRQTGTAVDFQTYIDTLEQTVCQQAIRIAQLEAIIAQGSSVPTPPVPTTNHGPDVSSTLDMAVEVEEGKGGV